MREKFFTSKAAFAALALVAGALQAQGGTANFDQAFSDSTLRIDCIFSGMPGDVSVSLSALHAQPGWPGRTHRLDSLMYAGNGDVLVQSLSGDTLYRNSFSSLFSEWLCLGESSPVAMEFTVLAPMPKDSVNVSVSLYDNRHRPIASMAKMVAPADILIRRHASEPLPHAYVSKGAYPGTKIKVAFLAEGYAPGEMDTYLADCRAVADAIFSHEPFAAYKDRFDFIAVMSPSAQSGVSVPSKGVWKDTAFKSHYSTFYSDRYLTSGSVFAMHDALRGIGADHIIVLANIDEYGGGGIFNSYALTTAHNPQVLPVAVHEFGHSFGGLADEYFYDQDVMNDTYPADVEPWEPNITTLTDFAGKWQRLLPPGTPIPTNLDQARAHPLGVYEGGGYSKTGVYRPADVCRMRVNDTDAFCPACQEALKNIILFYTE